jgi:hypothetical protein
MKNQILSNRDGIKIPHADMVALRQAGVINLGIENELSATIAGVTNIGPKKTTAVAAFQFWNWIAVGIFAGSIYWSFTKSWWWFILGLIVMRAIWSANKKGNAENFLDAAMIDKEFYERILNLNGWMYQFNEEDMPRLAKFFSLTEAEYLDPIAKFSRLMGEIDVLTTFWDESMLGAPKKELQSEIIRQIKATNDPKLKDVLSVALLATCNFFPDLGQPVSLSVNPLDESMSKPYDLTDDELKALAIRFSEQRDANASLKYESLRNAAVSEYEALKNEHGIV